MFVRRRLLFVRSVRLAADLKREKKSGIDNFSWTINYERALVIDDFVVFFSCGHATLIRGFVRLSVCLSVRQSVRWFVVVKLESVKTRILATQL